jgi:uncharacterized membrane protein YccC
MTALTNTQKIEALERAQEALRQNGWCRYNFATRSGQICATTALAVGQGLSNSWHLYQEQWEAMFHSDLLDEVVADMPMPTEPCMDSIARICLFNNEADRKDDVIAQFQITIDRLKTQEALIKHRELVNA